MRMRWPYIALLVAIGLGLMTTYLAYQWMVKQSEARVIPRHENLLVRPVVVAALDLPPGTKLRPESLKVLKWPKESVPTSAVSNPEELVDRVIKEAMIAGEPFQEARLAPIGTEGGLSAIISPGKRAMSVRVDEVIGVAGFVGPGSYVDVMVTLEDKLNRKLDATVKTILQNIKVLAAGQEVVDQKNEPVLVNVVTLEVTLEEAQKLALAANRGRLQLALRNQMDDQQVKASPIHTPNLITPPARSGSAADGKTSRDSWNEVVEIIRGSERTRQNLRIIN